MIRVNENTALAKEIMQKVKDNGGFCPCKLIKSEENKCICKEFKEQENGWCHCGLYYKF